MGVEDRGKGMREVMGVMSWQRLKRHSKSLLVLATRSGNNTPLLSSYQADPVYLKANTSLLQALILGKVS